MNNDYMQRVREWLQTEDGKAALAKMRENADQNINPLHDLDMRLFDSYPRPDYGRRPSPVWVLSQYDSDIEKYWYRTRFWGCFTPPRAGG